MPVTRHNPKTVPLAGKYTHGVELLPGQRVLYVSGQVGTDAKGKVAAGIEKQCDNVFKNIGTVLKSAGMNYADIIKVTVFLTDPRYIGAFRAVRDQYIHDPFPASTLLIVSGLASPDMMVEVEVIAARP